MGNACILAMEPAPLSGDWTQAVSCVSFIPLKKHVQLHTVCPVNCCDWQHTGNAGTQHSTSKWALRRVTEQLKHPVLWELIMKTTYRRYLLLTILYSTENAKLSELTHVESTTIEEYMHPTHEAGTSTTKTQLNNTKGDWGYMTQNKYQMALRNCKVNKREGTNGTVTCCVYICNAFFFFVPCLNYYGFEFLYKIKVTEAEFSADCGTRVPTRGVLWEKRFEASKKPLRKGFKQHCF